MRARRFNMRGFNMRGFNLGGFELRTAALVAIALMIILAGAHAARDRSVDDEVWLLPYESVR